MEYTACTPWGLQVKKSKVINKKLTNKRLAGSREYYQQNFKTDMSIK